MNIYFEPVNLNQWNIFEKVRKAGHVEPFLATKSMEEGDLILLHVGSQNTQYDSGIYAIGTIVNGPYILRNSPEDYCNNKNTVDVQINYISHGGYIISHEDSKNYIHQFRTVHKISDEYYGELVKIIKKYI